MPQKTKQSGFAAVETILVVVILAILGGTGWYVWHSKQAADKSLSQSSASNLASKTPVKKAIAVTDFISCKKAVGSRMLYATPVTCISSTGVYYTWVPQKIVSGATNTTVVETTLSKTPATLQKAAVSYGKTKGCVNTQGQFLREGGIIDDPLTWLVTDTAASVGMCSARTLFTDVNSVWQVVGSSQGNYDCDTLQKYKIPSTLVTTQLDKSCYDKASGETNIYTD